MNTAHTAAQTARALGMGVGLHLNLTEGHPLSPPHCVPSLVCSNGTMLGKALFWERAAAGAISENHIAMETNAQLRQYRALMGRYPLRVDGHQHTHIIPVVFTVLCNVLPSYGVQYIRIPKEACDASTVSPFLCNVAALAQSISHHTTPLPSLHTPPLPPPLPPSLFYTTAHFWGLSTMGRNMTLHNAERLASDVQDGDTIEWMIHPGYPSLDGDDFSQSEERRMEMEFLLSAEFQEFLSRNGLTVTPLTHWLPNDNERESNTS